MWDPVVERLNGARRVLALDLPGHGDEPASWLTARAPPRSRTGSPATRGGAGRTAGNCRWLVAEWRRCRSVAARDRGSPIDLCASRRSRAPARAVARAAAALAAMAALPRRRARAGGQCRAPGAHPAGCRPSSRPRVCDRTRLPGRQRCHARQPLHRAGRHRRAGHARVARVRPTGRAAAIVARCGWMSSSSRVRAPADVGRPGAGGSRVAGGQRRRTSTPALREAGSRPACHLTTS